MTAFAASLAQGGKLEIAPRNRNNLVYVNGKLVHRDKAVVSVYDSGFMLGDGVWEGIRLSKGAFLFLDEHLDRLFAGAKTIGMELPWSRKDLVDALRATVRANKMEHNVHVRLMITRGTKITPDQDPRLSLAPTIVIIPEYKDEIPDANVRGLKLVSVHIRRGLPDTQDPKLNSHSKLNCILAMLQAMQSQADEGLMMDVNGFVNTCNSVNFFIIRRGEVWTSTGDYCMNGITRAKTIEVCRAHKIVVREKNFSLMDVYSADGAFVTGTTGGQTPVLTIDGRTIGDGSAPAMLWNIRKWYKQLVAAYARKNRFA
jgi:branched-chain amino acid aminotransferase